jgi:hypothetical protein
VPAVVQRTVTPNPVPFSGEPITFFPQCVGVPNTWFYDDLLTNDSSVLVTITRIVDRLDGVVTKDITVSSPMPPGTSRITNYQWCSASPGQHLVDTTYTIVDANSQLVTIKGPGVITLLAKPFFDRPRSRF